MRAGVSLYFDSPRNLSSLPMSDPLDHEDIEFWDGVTDKLYEHVPDLLGYLVKANSEGQPGKLLYNRTLAEGTNMSAKALKPHEDGIAMSRAFVYDHHLSEGNWYNDRANAAVEFFKHLDGQFDDNFVIQIKYGPIDFQVRQPPSPLFANLLETSMVIELQVTQEGVGQQPHLVYWSPMWKEILDCDLRVGGEPSVIRDILSGKRFNRSLGGYAAVVNIAMNEAWLGSHLAMSNLYAYGQLARNPLGDNMVILEDWTRLLFGSRQTIIDTVTDMSLESWPAYENYTRNLGIQTLTDILYTHFGSNPASQDGNGWGQYSPEVPAMYEDIETTPDDLLLWFHRVPYTQRLRSGKTVIQHFYDAHYAGAETAQTFPKQWAAVKGLIDDDRFDEVTFRLEYQAGHSIVWRDAINNFCWNLSGISDEADRVSKYPWRVEAKGMELDGYEMVSVTPFETASTYKAIHTTSNSTTGSVTATLNYPSDTYGIAVKYYDVMGGVSKYEIFVNDESIGKWAGDLEYTLGYECSEYLDGHSATRVTFRGVEVAQGDVLKIVGQPDDIEKAPLDYVVMLLEGVVD